MSNTLDSDKLSQIIQTATNEIVDRTENFIKSVEDNPVGTDTITVMFNGKEKPLSSENYCLLKSQNDLTKARMKAEMKAIISKFKEDMKEKAPQ